MNSKEKIIDIVGFGIEPERAEIIADNVILAMSTEIIPKVQQLKLEQETRLENMKFYNVYETGTLNGIDIALKLIQRILQ